MDRPTTQINDTRSCPSCLRRLKLVQKGKDQFWVHATSGGTQCRPVDFCTIASPIHILADGEPCPDERHTENPEVDAWDPKGPFNENVEGVCWWI